MKSKRIFSVFALVVVMLVAVACVVTPPATPVPADAEGVSAPETFKSLAVKGLADFRSDAQVGDDLTVSGDLDVVGTIDAGALISDGDASLVSVATSGNITATGGFVGALTGNVTGDVTGNVTGDLTGNVTGDLTGIVTATSATVGGGYGSTGCTLSAAGVLQCNGAMTVDGAATVGGALNVTGTLGIGGVTFSGVSHWGSASSYTSGSSISHGFATTPTTCFMLPVRDVTSTVTITATGFSSDRATTAAAIRWWCGQ